MLTQNGNLGTIGDAETSAELAQQLADARQEIADLRQQLDEMEAQKAAADSFGSDAVHAAAARGERACDLEQQLNDARAEADEALKERDTAQRHADELNGLISQIGSALGLTRRDYSSGALVAVVAGQVRELARDRRRRMDLIDEIKRLSGLGR
jgi:DNA repair exonuclease SbcCD ATPase subunit